MIVSTEVVCLRCGVPFTRHGRAVRSSDFYRTRDENDTCIVGTVSVSISLDRIAVGLQTADMTRPKRPRDPNQLAKMITDLTTRMATEENPDAGKSAAAMSRGRKGGIKGGRSRADKLTEEQRRASASRAARARWSKREK